MALTHVLKEISSVSAFFVSRDGSGGDVSGLQKSFADSVLNKLKLVKDFGAGDGAQLHEALKGNQFGPTHTQRVKDAIDALVQKTASQALIAGNPKCADVPKQLLKCWWNYFTQDKIDFLHGNNSINAKMTLMVETGMDVGCVKPKEDTYKWCLAMLLLCHYRHVPMPKEIYDKLQDLKKAWVCEAKPFYLDHVQEFPEMPEHLPRNIYQQAYPDAKPVCLRLQGINTIAESIPLRANSKIIKKSKSRSEVLSLDEAYAECRDSRPAASSNVVKREPATPVKHEAYDSDEDPDVIVLRKEFEFKLAQLKASKKEPHDKQPPPLVNAEPVERLTISRMPTGGLQVTQRIEPEPAAPLPPSAADLVPERTDAPPPPSEADLDPWTKAALDAMNLRSETKKEEQKAERASKKRDAGDILKRPAAAPKQAKTGTASSDAKKTAKQGKGIKKDTNIKKDKHTKNETNIKKEKSIKKESELAEEEADVPKSRIMASMPKNLPKDGSSPRPVRYWGGVIYTAAKAKKFRALRVRGDRWSEASAVWGGDKPSKEAWRKCVEAIEAHRKK